MLCPLLFLRVCVFSSFLTEDSNDLRLQSELVLEALCNESWTSIATRDSVRGVADLVPHVSRDHDENGKLRREEARKGENARVLVFVQSKGIKQHVSL